MNEPVENPFPISDSEAQSDFAVDEVLARIQHDFRWPKPNDEAIASALRSIQKVAIHAAAEEHGSGERSAAGTGCPKCGEWNSPSNRFCGYCGTSLQHGGSRRPPSSANGGHHVHHHHYHHHFFETSGAGKREQKNGKIQENTSSFASENAEQAAADVQSLVRDWVLHCNSKRIDELVVLYSPEAIVLRPDAAPARGLAEVRQIFNAAFDAGLSDVELDGSDTGILGAIACLTGRCRMLLAPGGSSREQTGRYLIVARRESGKWKILADSWILDSISTQPAAKASPIPSKPQRKVS